MSFLMPFTVLKIVKEKKRPIFREANGLGTRLVGLLWHYTFKHRIV